MTKPSTYSIWLDYVVLGVGFLLAVWALAGSHVTLVSGDHVPGMIQAVVCSVLVFALFAGMWRRLHPAFRVLAVFPGLVAAWSLWVASNYLLGWVLRSAGV